MASPAGLRAALYAKHLTLRGLRIHQFVEKGAVFEAAVHALAADGTDLEISALCY